MISTASRPSRPVRTSTAAPVPGMFLRLLVVDLATHQSFASVRDVADTMRVMKHIGITTVTEAVAFADAHFGGKGIVTSLERLTRVQHCRLRCAALYGPYARGLQIYFAPTGRWLDAAVMPHSKLDGKQLVQRPYLYPAGTDWAIRDDGQGVDFDAIMALPTVCLDDDASVATARIEGKIRVGPVAAVADVDAPCPETDRAAAVAAAAAREAAVTDFTRAIAA